MFNSPRLVVPHYFLFINVVKVGYDCRVNADQEVMEVGMAPVKKENLSSTLLGSSGWSKD